MPFEELPHTADWSMHVWAEDLNHLFVESAKGMNALAGICLAEKPRVERIFTVSAPDLESLLVTYLSELVYFSEHDCLAFDIFNLLLSPEEKGVWQLNATLSGALILSSNKTIKAVTYHNLLIQQTGRGVEVEIVFDV
jgi:SHS2 domain-containing protein